MLIKFLQNEIQQINNNFNVLRQLKDNTINVIEEKKLELRKKSDPVYLYWKNKSAATPEPRVSVTLRDEALILMDKDISSIQNQFDLIYNDLQEIKQKISEHIEVVNKTDLIMNLLNYKMYETQYDFITTINNLVDKRKEIQQSTVNESQKAIGIVNIDKEITETEENHNLIFQSVKQQKLEAQSVYEKSMYILDNFLTNIKKYFEDLLLLIETQKSYQDIEDLPHVILLKDLEQDIDYFSKLQNDGWRSHEMKSISDVPKGVRMTPEGLLVTESGRNITLQEVQDQKLLDFLELVDYVKESSKTVLDDLISESKGSTNDSLMSSEDVSYLKKHLGYPLTLALAEITAVQPRDPIHYLGHWLFKYRYNQEISEIKKIELDYLTEERDRIAAEKWHKFIEEEAKAAVIDIVLRAEHQAYENELMRIARENEAAEEEEENLAYEARDRFDL